MFRAREENIYNKPHGGEGQVRVALKFMFEVFMLKEFRYQVKFSCSCHNICSCNHNARLIEIALLLKHAYLKFHKHILGQKKSAVSCAFIVPVKSEPLLVLNLSGRFRHKVSEINLNSGLN